MTTVITRYFEDAGKAALTEDELIGFHRVSPRILERFEDANSVATRMQGIGFADETIAEYKKRLGKGGAVLMIHAGYKPLAVARLFREFTAQMGAIDVGDVAEEVLLPKEIAPRSSILTDHPRLFTRAPGQRGNNYHMANWPIPLISRRKPSNLSLIPAHGRMASWPVPLISRRKPKDNFAFPRHARMADMILPLISQRKPKDNFAFPRHARMADMILPLISRRKPWTKSIFPRHQRMATVPFPLLINGKTGGNALIPGAPRMANFPIPLLSDRKPKDNFAFPRHARMANFPIPLISQRKPKDNFAFPRHARMADAILPLIVGNNQSAGEKGGFSFSKLFGMPTLIRR